MTSPNAWTRFSLQQAISNLREYQREYKLTTAQAFEGICEGHELTLTEELELAAAIRLPRDCK